MAKVVLVISQFYEPSVNLIVSKLSASRVNWIRFNTETYPMVDKGNLQISNGQFQAEIIIEGKTITPDNISSVWYRRIGKPLIPDGLTDKERSFIIQESRTSLRGLFNSFDRSFWVNDHINELLASDKITQLKLAAELGFRIPNTLISNNPEKIIEFYENNDGNVVFKPISGVSFNPPENAKEVYNAKRADFILKPELPEGEHDLRFIFTQRLDPEKIKSIGNAQFCPTIFQAYIDKEVELRITVVGEDILSCAIHSQDYDETKTDFRRMTRFPNLKIQYTIYQLPKDIQDKIHDMMKTLGIVFGCFDVIKTKQGEYYFLEVNPSGQWMWIETATNLRISDALVSLLSR